ncbi:TFIIH/NER complex subunit [Parahypoxylon ruwenzoriense]
MSRKQPSSLASRPNADPASTIPDEFCPVCKRMRYLNRDMEFLINPECYHPMCSSCVNNIFGKGPAQCPYASCTKTLRQRGFRSSFFGDLTVEREVDVRRRVQAVFNMTQNDFVSLRLYNDYLQQVEDLTFALVSGGETERRAAEADLLAYEQKHREEIERNKKRGRDAEAQRRQRDAAEVEAAKQRRLEEQREEERARAEEASINTEVMEALARGEPGTAAEIQARIVEKKRIRIAEINNANFSKVFAESATSQLNPISGPGGASSLLSIRGLKDKAQRDKENDDYAAREYYSRPYDPFAGLDLTSTRYTLHEHYENPWLEEARTRDDHRVPGYSTQEYISRAIFEAYSGLGVFIADEKRVSQRIAGTIGAEATVAAATAKSAVAIEMEVDDVFG